MARQASRQSDTSGFAAIEAVLIIVIMAALLGVGAYVLHQKKKANTTLSTVSSTSTPAQVQPKASGTSASVDQLTTQDAQTEAATDSSADSQAMQTSTSSNSAVSNVGGAYNENNL